MSSESASRLLQPVVFASRFRPDGCGWAKQRENTGSQRAGRHATCDALQPRLLEWNPARHSRAAQAVANIARLRVTHLQQTAVLDATLCFHFAAVRLLLRLSADATRGPLPPCCDSRHASSRQMCGAGGDVLGQVAEMKLGLQHCYGIRSNGNKPAGGKTSAGAQRQHVVSANSEQRWPSPDNCAQS